MLPPAVRADGPAVCAFCQGFALNQRYLAVHGHAPVREKSRGLGHISSQPGREPGDRVLHMRRPLRRGAASYIASIEAEASGPPLHRGAQPRVHSRQRVETLDGTDLRRPVSPWCLATGSLWSQNAWIRPYMVRRSELPEQLVTRCFVSLTWSLLYIRVLAIHCSSPARRGFFTPVVTYESATEPLAFR